MKSAEFPVQSVPLHRDRRGIVFEPVEGHALAAQKNCHVALTEPGGIRGNHYHRTATEITVVLGPARVRVRQGATLQEIEVPDGEAWRLVFPPGVPHAIQNTGSRTLLLVSFTDQVFDRAQPDVVADPLID